MQASVRSVSWIVARTAKKGLISAALPHLPGRFLGARSVGGFQLRRWPCRYVTPPLFKPSPASADMFLHSASAVTGGGIDECLLQSVRDEIRSLKAADVDMEVELPPEPFVLREKPGCVDVILQRQYDQERVTVECELLLQPPDNGGDDEDDDGDNYVHLNDNSAMVKYALLINLTITVTKGGPEALEISCQCHGDEYFINYISYHEDFCKERHDYAVHEKQLSEDLKREFLFFLFLRGFDDEMAVFLHHYLEKKRNEERISNLENVAAVLANQ